ncbi:hypothetical protein PHSC3_000155 [Chlamydiales bacterium STE3]|nr:hypothetical protein PHSC3_000155 [Chlamydiales bacterium STE3]
MKTTLYHKHIALEAKIVDDAGKQKPVYYERTVVEHFAVRKATLIFDVSLKGIFYLKGQGATRFINSFIATPILHKPKSSSHLLCAL